MISFNNKWTKVLSEAFIEPGLDLGLEHGITQELYADIFNTMDTEIGSVLRDAIPYINQKIDQFEQLIKKKSREHSGTIEYSIFRLYRMEEIKLHRIIELFITSNRFIDRIVGCIGRIQNNLRLVKYGSFNEVVYGWITQFINLSGRAKKTFENVAKAVSRYDTNVSEHFLLLSDKIINSFNVHGRETLISVATHEFNRHYENEDDALRDLLSAPFLWWMKTVGPKIMKPIAHRYPDYGRMKICELLLPPDGSINDLLDNLDYHADSIATITTYWPVTLQQIQEHCQESNPDLTDWIRSTLELANEEHSIGLIE